MLSQMENKIESTHTISFIGVSNSGRHSLARSLTSSLGNIVDDYFSLIDQKFNETHIFKILPIITPFEPERRDYVMTFTNFFVYVIDSESQDSLDLNLIAEAIINSNCTGMLFALNKVDLIPENEREYKFNIWQQQIYSIMKNELAFKYFGCEIPYYFTVVSTFDMLNISETNTTNFLSLKEILISHHSAIKNENVAHDSAVFLIFEKYLDTYDYHTKKTLVITGQVISGSANRELKANEFTFLGSNNISLQADQADISLEVSIPLIYHPFDVTTLKFTVESHQECIASSLEMGDLVLIGPTKNNSLDFIFFSDTLEVECLFYELKNVLVSPGTKFIVRFKDSIREAEILKLLEKSELELIDETQTYNTCSTSSKPKFISKQSIVKMIIKLNKSIRRSKFSQQPKLSLFSTRLGTSFNLYGRILKYKS